jgi:hypothetical protein
MFRAVRLPIIRSFPLCIRHWYMSWNLYDLYQLGLLERNRCLSGVQVHCGVHMYSVPVICIWKHTRMMFSVISYMKVTIVCKSRRVLNLYVAGRLRPLACWDWDFEPRRGRGCLSLVSVVCRRVEVSAAGWPGPLGAVASWRKKCSWSDGISL